MQELPFHSASLNSSQEEILKLSAVSEVSEQVADEREDFSLLTFIFEEGVSQGIYHRFLQYKQSAKQICRG